MILQQIPGLRKHPFPALLQEGYAAGFSIGNKGYIGTGLLNMEDHFIIYKDFWEWDQATNVWTKKADFAGMARYGAVGFSIGNKGYIGTGYGVMRIYLFKDFWEWDQATDTWTKKADFGGAARASAVGFSIGNKGYIGTGYDGGILYYKDFWEWDQATDAWTRKADFAGDARIRAVGVSIGNKGYIGTGIGGTVFLMIFGNMIRLYSNQFPVSKF